MRRHAQQEYFRYLPVSKRDRRWDLYVTGTGRIVRATPGDPDAGHPEPYYYVWENGRALSEFGALFVTEDGGEFESEASGKKTVTAGNVVLLFPNVWHRYRPSKNTGWTYYWTHFGGGYAKYLTDRWFISPKTPVLETGLDETVFHAYRCLLDRVRCDPPGLQQLAAANVMEILGASLAAVRSRRSGTELDGLVRRAMRHIEQATEDLVDMNRLAVSLDLSYDRFRHIFKEHTGLAPYQYHLQLRINRAKELLAETNMSIKELATALKFESPYHFSTIFKKKTGMSPTQWRGRSETGKPKN